jgi:hypothetical protein
MRYVDMNIYIYIYEYIRWVEWVDLITGVSLPVLLSSIWCFIAWLGIAPPPSCMAIDSSSNDKRSCIDPGSTSNYGTGRAFFLRVSLQLQPFLLITLSIDLEVSSSDFKSKWRRLTIFSTMSLTTTMSSRNQPRVSGSNHLKSDSHADSQTPRTYRVRSTFFRRWVYVGACSWPSLSLDPISLTYLLIECLY